MSKNRYIAGVGASLLIAAGSVETMPILSVAAVGVMLFCVMRGKLWEAIDDAEN